MPITPIIPSESTSGTPILLAEVATPGDLLHTAVAGSSSVDECYFYAYNDDTVERDITYQLGGVAAKDSVTRTIQPKSGETLEIPGHRYNGGVSLRAFGSVTNKIAVSMTINRWVAPA